MVCRDLAPAIEPINIGWITSHTAPTRNYWNEVELVVAGEELGRRIVQGFSTQAFSKTSGRYEALGVSAPTDIEFIDDARIEDMDPVRRTTVVGVQIV